MSLPGLVLVHGIHLVTAKLGGQPAQIRWRVLPQRSTRRSSTDGTEKDRCQLVEMVYPGGVPTSDLRLLLLGTFPQSLLDESILLEAQEHVAVEIVGGKHIFLESVAVLLKPLGMGVIQPVQEMGNLGQLVVHCSYL